MQQINDGGQVAWWVAFRGLLTPGPTKSERLLAEAQQRMEKLERKAEREAEEWMQQAEG